MGHDRGVLSYADEGAGSVVVLLHGWPVTPLHWRRITPGLIDAGFRVLTVTLPDSETPRTKPWPAMTRIASELWTSRDWPWP